MLLDDATAKLKTECEKFLALSFHTEKDSFEAFEAVRKAVQMVLATANMVTGQSGDGAAALEVFRKHRDHNDVRQDIRISFMPDGHLMKEDSITCLQGCHTYAKQAYRVDLEGLSKYGVKPRDLVRGLSEFLKDPTGSLANLSSSLKN